MLTEINIGSYRGLQNVFFKDLKRINIFAGANNCGKTTALEAIVMLGICDNIDLLLNTLFSRYNSISIDMIKSIFNNSMEEPLICLGAKLKNKEDIHTHITYTTEKVVSDDEESNSLLDALILAFDYDYKRINKELNHDFYIKFDETDKGFEVRTTGEKIHNNIEFPCRFISFSRMEKYSQMIKAVEELLDNNMRDELLDVLKLFDNSISNFEIIGNKRAIKIFKNDKESALYLNDYGNGMYKAFFIAASALLCENGVLLIDEIETGVHHKALVGFISYLTDLCYKKNIQLFFTTHSLEAIDSILESNRVDLSDISLFHLKNSPNQISVRRYSGDRMFELRNEVGFDMR